MRIQAFNVLVAVVGLVNVSSTAPALSYCLASISTVYVTLLASTTVDELAATTTSFSTLSITSTISASETIYVTITGQTLTNQVVVVDISAAAEASSKASNPSYDVTITETEIVTVTNFKPYSAASSYSEASNPNEFFYSVANGTTYWLNGQTPAPSGSYVYATTVITVIPLSSVPASASSEDTIPVAIGSTAPITSDLGFKDTLRPSSISTSLVSAVLSSNAVAAVSSFTGMAPGGWNQTTFRRVDVSTEINAGGPPVTTITPIAVEHEFSSADVYQSTVQGQSGFNVITTARASTTTSNAAVEWTTAIENGQSASWGGSTVTDSISGVVSSETTTPNTSLTAQSQTFSSSSTGLLPLDSTSSSLIVSISSGSALRVAASSNSGLLTTLSSSSSDYGETTTSSLAAQSSASTTVASSSSLSVTSMSSTDFETSRTTSLPFILQSTSAGQSTTSVSSTASASPSNCGEIGDFTLNFDDIPPLSVSNTSTDYVGPEPVFNPYHQFDFSNGFTVVPPPTDPYLPSSRPLLLEFIPNFNVNSSSVQVGSNNAKDGFSGQISDGDGGATGCFRFNIYGASFGCDSQGPDCNFWFSGFRLDPATGITTQAASQGYSVSACPALANCALTPITLDNTFQDLTFIRINVTVQSAPKIWWMDDLSLGWFNNSCTAGFCRQNTRVH